MNVYVFVMRMILVAVVCVVATGFIRAFKLMFYMVFYGNRFYDHGFSHSKPTISLLSRFFSQFLFWYFTCNTLWLWDPSLLTTFQQNQPSRFYYYRFWTLLSNQIFIEFFFCLLLYLTQSFLTGLLNWFIQVRLLYSLFHFKTINSTFRHSLIALIILMERIII